MEKAFPALNFASVTPRHGGIWTSTSDMAVGMGDSSAVVLVAEVHLWQHGIACSELDSRLYMHGECEVTTALHHLPSASGI